ncbi:MAG: PA2779 family protein [Deltaproteobacteria bacterium]|nr:PA2779 family protein [Deltaproteobacteria bacterium]
MTSIRRTGWFLALAVALSCWMGALGSLRGVAEAGVIASRVEGADLRAADIAKVQTFLERKIVAQKLVDYGVSPEEATAKVLSMEGKELHRLAALTDRAASGSDSGADAVVGLAVLLLLILLILWLMNKKVVIR